MENILKTKTNAIDQIEFDLPFQFNFNSSSDQTQFKLRSSSVLVQFKHSSS